MKRTTALIATLMLTAMAMQPVRGEEAPRPDQSAAAAAPSADQTIQKMQANTRRMQNQLEQMAKTKDPAQRQKLLQEHMQTMQENMLAGRGMMGGGMTDCPMMQGGMMGPGMSGSDDMMARRMEMMEKRMDMMQMMMQRNMGMPPGAPASPTR